MVMVDLLDYDPATKQKTDYIELGKRIEKDIRTKFEDASIEIQIIASQGISDIAEGAKSVLDFSSRLRSDGAVGVLYCRSIKFTSFALACSLVSLVWQFGSLRLLGYGLDPLAILVPFLVFAIGVSHGVPASQFHLARDLRRQVAVRGSPFQVFTGLLIPGTMAL